MNLNLFKKILLLFFSLYSNIAFSSFQNLNEINCDDIALNTLLNLGQDFQKLHSLYAKKFYDPYSTTLLSSGAFLQELSYINIKKIEIAGKQECMLCQSKTLVSFFVLDVNLSYIDTRTNEGQLKHKLLKFEFFLNRNNNGKLYGLIGKIISNTSSNLTDCYNIEDNFFNRGVSLELENLENEYQKKVDLLDKQQKDLNQLKGNLSNLKKEKKVALEKIKTQEHKINQLAIDVKTAKEQLEKMTQILSCIQEIEMLSSKNRKIAKEKLAEARHLYKVNFLTNRKDIEEWQQKDIIEKIWSIYSTYSSEDIEIDCGKIKIAYNNNHKIAEDNLLIVRLLSNNEGNIIELLGEDLREQINVMNKTLLTELGRAIEVGNYQVKTEGQKIVERIPDLIIPERKESVSSEIIQGIATIPKLFEREKYAEVVGLYGKYHRLFELEELKNGHMEKIIMAKYCVGAVLTWNLGDLEFYKAIYIDNLLINKNRYSRLDKGRELLTQVAENDLLPDYQMKAAIILAKQFK